MLPDLGGYLYTCTDKVNGQDLFYANTAIKLASIAYRGAWAALGIEFNFPVSHNWMTVSPVDYRIVTNPDRSASIWVGNIDRVYGGQWRVALTLKPHEAVLEQRTYLYNASPQRHRFYWWTNAAVRVTDESRILYPMRYTASHGFTEVDTWPVDKNGHRSLHRRQSQVRACVPLQPWQPGRFHGRLPSAHPQRRGSLLAAL